MPEHDKAETMNHSAKTDGETGRQGDGEIYFSPRRFFAASPRLLFLCVSVSLWLIGSHVVASAHAGVEEQIAQVSAAIEKNPNDPQLFLKRGELHRLNCNLKAALTDYADAERLAPALDEVDFCRGRLWLEAGVPEQALLSLNRFLTKHKDHTEALLTRARANRLLRQNRAAADDFTRAIELQVRTKPDVYVERARALSDAGTQYFDEAIRGLDEGINRLGQLIVLQLTAIELEVKAKRFDAALARLDALAPQYARKESWLVRRGEIFWQAGRKKEAREAFNSALREIAALPPHLRSTRAVAQLKAELHHALKKR